MEMLLCFASTLSVTSMSWFESPGEFPGLDVGGLGVDRALVNVTSDEEMEDLREASLWSRAGDCYQCRYKWLGNVSDLGKHFEVATHQSYSWKVQTGNGSTFCELEASPGEFGVYELLLRGANSSSNRCRLETHLQPVNIYLPLVVTLLFLLALWLAVYLVPLALRYWNGSKHAKSEKEGKREEEPAARTRLKSIDTFRGVSIVVMIFVNYGAGGYTVLGHATWNGLHLADLVFPWFMWIMGTCIPISLRALKKKSIPRAKILGGILRRSCLLFLLGLVVNTTGVGGRLETLRIFGVLQRFSVCYFVTASLMVLLPPKKRDLLKFRFSEHLRDFLILLPHWCIMLAILLVYLCLIFLLPVPGCPTGYLGPGGLHSAVEVNSSCVGGATGYVDRRVLGEKHIYRWPTSDAIYESGAFDPEGFLGCLPSIFHVFLGVQAGTTLLTFTKCWDRIVRWLCWGSLCGFLAAILTRGTRDEGWIPVNKNLWSLSFVLVTCCFAFFLLSACYFVVDVKQWWGGEPFFYPGRNATVMYVGHELTQVLFPWNWSVGRMNSHFLQLVECLWGVAAWVLVAFWLHHVDFFLSL